jgi:hypothetical protein
MKQIKIKPLMKFNKSLNQGERKIVFIERRSGMPEKFKIPKLKIKGVFNGCKRK